MKGYLIKVTNLTGDYIGKEWFLRKTGYVTTADAAQWKEDVYLSLGHAKRACERLAKENKINFKIERQDAAHRIKQGKSTPDRFIYELEQYEPFEVDYYSWDY